MLTYQSMENVLVSRLKRIGKIIGIALIITACLVALCHIIIPGCWVIAKGVEKPAIEPAAPLTDAEKAEQARLMKKHGLSGVVVLEIGKDGQLYFYRDGQKCRFM